mmetsp:Transcript_17278/g.32714  ORF Transcript_17278/g.32714 Transcript_17278/m.32714 type:complete len:263 (-) Transcript_17278:408-1196(-)
MIRPMIAQVFTFTTLLGIRTTTTVAFLHPSLRQKPASIFPKPPINLLLEGRGINQSTKLPFSSVLVKMSSLSTSTDSNKKRVLVPIAEGSEEIETSSITDVLTRFGAHVVVASVMPDLVCKMSRGLKICADVSIENAAKEEWDLIALPGGLPGANHLRDSLSLVELLKRQKEKKKLYGAVCASPAVVLHTHGLLSGAGATCYPAPPFRSVMEKPSDSKVVVQDNVVTSQGPGTSLLFALSLGEQLYGKEHADKVAAELLVQR